MLLACQAGISRDANLAALEVPNWHFCLRRGRILSVQEIGHSNPFGGLLEFILLPKGSFDVDGVQVRPALAAMLDRDQTNLLQFGDVTHDGA